MKPTSKLLTSDSPAKPLAQVLKENEIVRGMVQESADELASVNVVLNEVISKPKPNPKPNLLPEMERALEKSEAVEIKVQEASEKLTAVNISLKSEVKERHLLEQELVKAQDLQKESHHAALHDALTGLPNRVLFTDRVEQGMEQAKRHGWTLAVMFLDLDQFKTINDTHGHGVGDAVLQTLATRLKETIRTNDTVSRHGGDEFLYLLLEVNEDQDAATVAEKIIKAVQVPCDVSVGPLTVRTSIGISIFPRDGTTVEALIKSADAAMYRAKQSQSGYTFSSEAPPSSA